MSVYASYDFHQARDSCISNGRQRISEPARRLSRYAYEFCEDAFQKKIEWLVEHECDYDYLNAISTVFAWRR